MMYGDLYMTFFKKSLDRRTGSEKQHTHLQTWFANSLVARAQVVSQGHRRRFTRALPYVRIYFCCRKHLDLRLAISQSCLLFK